jgi:hypothetical protein
MPVIKLRLQYLQMQLAAYTDMAGLKRSCHITSSNIFRNAINALYAL